MNASAATQIPIIEVVFIMYFIYFYDLLLLWVSEITIANGILVTVVKECCLVDINLAAWSSVHISFSKTFRFESSCVIAVDLNEAVLKILLLACLFVDLTHCENVPEDEEYNETQDNPKDDHPDSTFTI